MHKLSRIFIEPFVAVYESAFPVKDDITWLDRQALQRKHAKDAHIADMDNPVEKKVIDLVSHIADGMGLVVPKIIIYQSDKSNAMHLNNNTLAISSAKLDEYRLESPELLAATIAHELTHQRQNAISNAVSVGRVFLDVGTGVAAGYLASQQPKQQGTISALVTATAAVIAGVATHLISSPLYSAFRRGQEYDADKNAAEIVGADNMIAVLEQKLEHISSSPSWTKKIMSKHPTHQERINALKEMEHSSSGISH